MSYITLTIPGKPLGKQRPRVTTHGTYTPEQTLNYETYIKQLFVTKYRLAKPMEGPLSLQVRAYFPIPKSASKTKATSMERGNVRPTKRPDIDNIIKIVADALNGIAYKDDSQIVSCSLEKFYSNIPRLEIEIEEVS